MNLKEIALDVVKLGRTHDEEATRFLKSNEQRLNENFRRLKEATESIMADFTDVYRKSEVDTLLSAKADVITNYGDLSQTGNRISNEPSAVSVASGSFTTVAQVTLTAGRWILIGAIRFASNATGFRRGQFANTADSDSSIGIAANDSRNAVNGGYTYCNFSATYVATGSPVIYLNAYQNSGSSLSCAGRLYAYRLS